MMQQSEAGDFLRPAGRTVQPDKCSHRPNNNTRHWTGAKAEQQAMPRSHQQYTAFTPVSEPCCSCLASSAAAVVETYCPKGACSMKSQPCVMSQQSSATASCGRGWICDAVHWASEVLQHLLNCTSVSCCLDCQAD